MEQKREDEEFRHCQKGKKFTSKQTFEKYIDKHKRMFYTNDYKQRKER